MEKFNGQSSRYNQIIQLRKKPELLVRGRTQRHGYVYLYSNFIAKIEIIKINNELAGAST